MVTEIIRLSVVNWFHFNYFIGGFTTGERIPPPIPGCELVSF